MLTFVKQPALLGISHLLALGAMLGVHERFSRCSTTGSAVRSPAVIAVGLAGIFQELIRPILANSRFTKPLHDLLYTWSGLTLQGAVIIFLAVAVAVLLWDFNRQRTETAVGRLKPQTQRRIRWSYMGAAALLSRSSRCSPAISSARCC